MRSKLATTSWAGSSPRPRWGTTRTSCASWARRTPSSARSSCPTVSTRRPGGRPTRRRRWPRTSPIPRWLPSSRRRLARRKSAPGRSGNGSRSCSSRRIRTTTRTLCSRSGPALAERRRRSGPATCSSCTGATPSGDGGRPTCSRPPLRTWAGSRRSCWRCRARGRTRGSSTSPASTGCSASPSRSPGAGSTRQPPPWPFFRRQRTSRSRSGPRTWRSTSTGPRGPEASR